MECWSLDPHQTALLLAGSDATRHPARDRAIATICLDAGLRRREAVALRVGDLDTGTWTVSVGMGVTRRVIRLGRYSRLALEQLLDTDRGDSSPLLVSRAGVAVTARVIHEQLSRAGELAGLGGWVTCRHTRRTYLQVIAGTHPLPIVMRLMGHAGDGRHRPASITEALEAQFDDAWVSPLDTLMSNAREPVLRAA